MRSLPELTPDVGKDANKLGEVETGLERDPEVIYIEYRHPTRDPWRTQVPQVLAELASEMAEIAAPVEEQVAKRLTKGQGTTSPLTVPTLLTEANRSAGRDGVRVKPKREASPELTVPRACNSCGVVLERQNRDHSDECMPGELRASAMEFCEAGRAKLEALRASGEDLVHSETANRLRCEGGSGSAGVPALGC